MKKAMSFGAGFVLALLMMLLSVLGPALRTDLFEQALIKTVQWEAIGTDEASLRLFAAETMAYLRGEKEAWEPAITLYGFPAEEAIAQSFRLHMAEVRGWVAAAPWVLGAGFALALGLFLPSRKRYASLTGLFCAVGILLAVLLWALVDFHSLWMILHRLFIPDGIFSAREPVMQLFPLALFFEYLTPVSITFLILLAAAFFLLRFTPPRS